MSYIIIYKLFSEEIQPLKDEMYVEILISIALMSYAVLTTCCIANYITLYFIIKVNFINIQVFCFMHIYSE